MAKVNYTVCDRFDQKTLDLCQDELKALFNHSIHARLLAGAKALEEVGDDRAAESLREIEENIGGMFEMASLNEVNKALYAALCMLRDEPSKRMPSRGICRNVGQMAKQHLKLGPEMCELVHDKFVEMAGEWPATKDKSGTYPVEGDFQVYDAHQRALTLWDNPRRLELLEWATQKAEAGEPVYVWPDLSYIEVSEYNENEFRHKGDDFWRLDHPIYHDDGRLWV